MHIVTPYPDVTCANAHCGCLPVDTYRLFVLLPVRYYSLRRRRPKPTSKRAVFLL
uniref:hypothetical protein n=1 Tax=Cupriavidus taiwanensis TaxID=164546 RepID=UPI00133138DA|nr:hypothetical protein [Cupriavidus taiwanensis]